MAMLPEIASPEDLEQLGFKKVEEGELKEGLKLILRAAKKYEDERKLEDAARLYFYLGYFFLGRLKKPETARKPLLKSASLYIKLIDQELGGFEIDTRRLNDFCSRALSVFASLGDEANLKKYAKYFAEMYEDLAKGYEESGELEKAIMTYEDAFRYYKILNEEESVKRIADAIVTTFGRITEERVASDDSAGAGDAFYKLSFYVLELFGYGTHFIEMMETAARNYERASKLSYSEGDLDGTTSYLLKSQYAYLLAGNSKRAKLIGLNNVRILYQVVGAHQKRNDTAGVSRKLLELAMSLFAVGKVRDSFKVYRESLNISENLEKRAVMRAAVLKVHAAKGRSAALLSLVGDMEYYIERGNPARAVELAEAYLSKVPELEETVRLLHEAEGITPSSY